MTSSLRVVLIAPRNPLNIGAAARAMSNFGFSEMCLVRPYDVAFREAKSAVKSHYILQQAQVFDSLPEAIAGCALVVGSTSVGNRDLHVPLYRLEAAGRLVKEALPSAPVALLFGSEKFGLSNEDISYCHWLFRIPSRQEHGSINLGQAVAITLYELRREIEAESQSFPTPPSMDAADAERFHSLLYSLLEDAGYIPERTVESAAIKLRQLILRSSIQAADAKTWLGMLRQLRWRMDQDKPV